MVDLSSFAENKKENILMKWFMRLMTGCFLVFFSISLSSCALIFNGSKQNVSVKSYTDDAKIYVDGARRGQDAITANLKRNNGHTISIRKEGCDTYTRQIRSNTQAGWIVFGILFNIPGLITDAATGAWNELEPTTITKELDCEDD
jgi:hypothetical protein